MHYWSIAFALIACATVVMGLNGLAGLSAPAAWGLFLTSVVLAVLSQLLRQKQDSAPLAPPRRDAARKFGDV